MGPPPTQAVRVVSSRSGSRVAVIWNPAPAGDPSGLITRPKARALGGHCKFSGGDAALTCTNCSSETPGVLGSDDGAASTT